MNIELRKADLQVVSIVTAKSTYCIGEDITYTVRIKNNGPNSVTGAKFTLDYPSGFQFTGVTTDQTTGASSNSGNTATATQFATMVDLENLAEMTLHIKGKATVAGAMGLITAIILRPADVTDPDATNPDDAIPVNAAAECSAGCNNIKTASSINITTVGINISNATVSEKTDVTSEIAFPVTLTSTSQCPVTVSYTITHGRPNNPTNATNDADFDSSVSKTGTVTIPAGQTTASIRIRLNADRIIEGNEVFTITLSNPVGGSLNSQIATGTITNDDSADLSITATPGSETGEVAGKFIFTISNVADVATEIDYALSGDATPGIDFTGPQKGTIIIPAGQNSYILSLPVSDDDIVEGDEIASLNITRLAPGHEFTIKNITTVPPTVTISDNDNARLELSSDVILSEGADQTIDATYTLTLSNPTSKKFTLNYRTEDMSAKVADNDYKSTGTVSLEFAGLKNEFKTITIPVVGDKKIEKDELIKLLIFNLSDSFGNRLTIPKDVAQTTIKNDDAGQISIISEDGEEGVKSGKFIFKLPDGVSTDTTITISYTLSGEANVGGIDYTTPVVGTLEIKPGENSATLILPVNDDAIAEGPETVLINATVGTNNYYIGLTNTSHSLKINDNDKALITIAPVSVQEGSNLGTTNAELEVVLNVSTAGPFSLSYKVQDGSAKAAQGDYSADIIPLQFNGTAGEKRKIPVKVSADKKVEGDETFSVILDKLSTNFGGSLSIGDPTAIGTIIDDDNAIINITAINGSENGPQNGSYLFSFPAGVTSDEVTRINFDFETDAETGVDFTPSASSFVEIPAGQSSAILTLAVKDDIIVEGEEKAKLKNLAVVSPYSRISLSNAVPQVAIEDNDAATLTLSGPIDGLETSDGPTVINFNIKLDKSVSKPFSVSYNTEDGTATIADNDYVSASSTQAFNGTAGENYFIPVTINGDKKVESSESFLLKLSGLTNNFGGKLVISPTQLNYTIKNDDTSELSLSTVSGAEGMYDGAVTFTLSNPVSEPVTVDYSLSGTAISGLDYNLPLSGTIVIPAGADNYPVNIPVLDDNILEETESIKISATAHSASYNIPVKNSQVSLDIVDNDEATITVTNPVSIPEGDTGSSIMKFEAALSKDISKPVTLKFKTVNGTALAGQDYVSKTGQLSFLPLGWKTLQPIEIFVTGDFSIEPDESFDVNLFDLSDNYGGRLKIVDQTVKGWISNDDGGDIKITHKDGAEGGQVAEFIFSFPGIYTSAQPTTIEYTLGGSASSGIDYTGASSKIVIPAGSSSISLPLSVNDDAIVEGDEEIELTVTSVDNNFKMSNTFDKLNIEDNDYATLTLHGPVNVKETDGGSTATAVFSVSLDKETSKSFDVNYSTTDGTAKASDNDYLPSNGKINFSAGSKDLRTISVSVNGDNRVEKNETFTVDLSNISNVFKDRKGNEHLRFSVNNAVGSIENDDKLVVEIEGENGVEGSKPANFLFRLVGGVADEDIKISYDLTGNALANGKDYTGATTGELIIPAGATSWPLTIPVADDAIVEDSENILLTAGLVGGSYSASGGVYPITLSNPTKGVFIIDNDKAAISVGDVKITEGDDNENKTLSFTLTLNNETSAGFDVSYATSDGSATVADGDYVPKSGTRHFDGKAGEQRTIDIIINGDRKVEDNEVFNLLLNGLSYNYNSNLSISAPASAKGEITNNDFAQIGITAVNAKEEGAKPGVFQFGYLNGYSSDKDVTVTYTLSGLASTGKDYTPEITSSVTIPAGQVSAPVTLSVIDDQIVEDNEDITITVSAVSSVNPVTLRDQQKSLIIEDNDIATITISNDISTDEGNAGQQTADFTISVDKETSFGFSVDYATADQTATSADNDYNSRAGALTFAANDITPKTINIPINGDTKLEGDETFTFSLGNLISRFNNRIKIADARTRTVTLRNDDFGDLKLTKVDGREGGNDPSFTIGFDSDITFKDNLTIDYFISGTAKPVEDFTGSNGSITILAGEKSKTITLPLVDDNRLEDPETIQITATLRPNNNGIVLKGSPQIITIEDNDKAEISISPVSISEGDIGIQKAVFAVKLKGATDKGFDLVYKTADGTATSGDGDYVPTPITGRTLHFNGTTDESRVIEIDINSDRKIEGDEFFTVFLEQPATNYANALTLENSADKAVGTIFNDDSGLIEVTATNFSENNPADAAIKFSFPAGVTSSKPTRINFSIGGSAEAVKDYTYTGSGWIEIPAGDESYTLPLPVVDDAIVEEEEKLQLLNIALEDPTNPNVTLKNTLLEVPVIDNDVANLSISGPVEIIEGANGASSKVNFTVTLNKAVQGPFSINYSTRDGLAKTTDNDYVATSGTLVFNGTAGEKYPVSVTVNGDGKLERDENFFVKLSQLSNTYENRLSIHTPDEVSTIIRNDDVPEIEVAKSDGKEGSTDGSITFTLSNNATSDNDIVINYSLSGTAELAKDFTLPVTGSATIKAGQRSSLPLVLGVVDDDIVENMEIVTASLTASDFYGTRLKTNSVNVNIEDNDKALVNIIGPVMLKEGQSGTSTRFEFYVTVDKELSKTITLQYRTADGTAIASSDYTAAAGTISLKSPSQRALIAVIVTGDGVIEKDETFTANIFDLSENFGGQLTISDATALGRILNDDGGDITITHKDGKEGGDVPEFTFSFPAGVKADKDTKIEFNLAGTAVAGADYTGAATSVTILAGDEFVKLQLPAVDDSKVERDEVVELEVTSIDNGLQMSNSFQSLSIEDNDVATLSLSVAQRVTETDNGTTSATFNVTLDKETEGKFSVDLNSADGTAKVSDNDYEPIATTLAFEGKEAETKPFSVIINGDTKLEKDEVLNLLLSNLTETYKDKFGNDRLTIDVASTIATIENDDKPKIKIDGQDGEEGVKGAGFVLRLSQGTADEDISISYSLSGNAAGDGNDKDYDDVSKGQAIIKAGETFVPVALPVIDDAQLEDTEVVTLNITAVNSPYIVTPEDQSKTASITDNDAAKISVSDVSVLEGEDGTKIATFSLVLNNATSRAFDVDFNTADGTALAADADYKAKAGQVHFNGTAGEEQTVEVVVNGDRKIESDEAFNLLLSNLSYNFANRLSLQTSAKGTIKNDDESPIFITAINGKEKNQEPAAFEFSYKPGYSSDKDATISYSLSGKAESVKDYSTSTPTSITIPAGQLKRSIVLDVVDDQIVEGAEDIILSITSVTSANKTNATEQIKGLTIEDDDRLTLTLSPDVSILEGDQGQTSANFFLTADKEVSSGYKISYTTVDQSAKTSDQDYIATQGSLSFEGKPNENQPISVSIKGDKKIEGDEVFIVQLGAITSSLSNLMSIPQMTGKATITNDDKGNLVISKTDGEEGLKDASFTIGFEKDLRADRTLKINYSLNGEAKTGKDYIGSSSVIELPAGENSIKVTLPVIDDGVVEDTEIIELEASVELNDYNITIPSGITPINIADNDKGLLSISPADINEKDAATKTLDFKVTLDKETTKPFTVQFSTLDGSATSATGDYNALSSNLSFSGLPGESQTIKVVVKDDKVVEAAETITARLNSISNTFNNRLTFEHNSATGTINDDDIAQISVSKVDGKEANSIAGKYIFSFKDNATSDKATTITYRLGGLAEANGVDFGGPVSGSVVIQPGAQSAELTLPVIDDIKVEGDEAVKIVNANCESPYNTAISLEGVYPDLIIEDNDKGTLVLSADVKIPEGDEGVQNATYTLTLDRATNSGFQVAYQTMDGTALAADGDYIPAIATLNFAGTAGESKSISIAVKGDKKIEPHQLFTLQVDDPTNTFGGALTVTAKSRTTTIENDDFGSVAITKVDGVEAGQAAAFNFSYPVGLTSDSPLKINYSLAGTAKGNGEDYTGTSPGNIIIPAGQNNITLTLPVYDDAIIEDKETVSIAASVSGSATDNPYNIQLANAAASLDILDNDNTTISITPASVAEGDNGTATLDFKLTLKKATGKPFTLPYQTADDAARVADNDYTSASANAAVSFAGTAGEIQTISIQVKGDKKIEANEALTLVLKDLSDNFNGRLVLESTSVTGTILNDDQGAVTITKTDGVETGAVAGTFTFSLPADMTSDQPIVINYSLDGTAGGNGVDYTGVTSAAITIPANQNKVTLSLPVINDAIVEEDETVVLVVNSLSSLHTSAVTVNPVIPVMKIMDDDFGDIALGGTIVKQEGNSGTTSFDFPVTLSKATGLPFTLKYSTSNGSATVEDNDYIPAIDQLVNFAGQAGEVQTIKVQVKGDLKLEADEVFNLAIHALSNTFGNKLQITNANSAGTIKNDDAGQIIVTKTDGTEGLQDAAFTFSFPQNVTSEAPTTITYRLSGSATSSDYIISGVSSVTIPAGTNSITLPIKVTDDNELEDVETIAIAVETISNSNSLLAWATPLPVVNINDNDKAEIIITGPQPVIEQHNGKTTVTFTVKLDNLTSKGFDVDYRTTNGSASTDDNDYVAKAGTLSFSGFAGETKQITVDVNGDLKVEGDELFNMVLSNISPNYGGRLTAKGSPAIARIINDDFAPVANPDFVTTAEDASVTFSVTANDTDVDGIDAKTIRIQTPPVKGTLSINADGTLKYTPVPNDYGTYTFIYTVKDNLGLESNAAIGTINVTPVNDPPVAINDEFYIAKDAAFRGTVAANDSDVDGDVLKFRLINAFAGAQLENFNVADGTFLYIPKKGFTGIEEFAYEVIDPAGLKDTATVRLKVQGNVTVSLIPEVSTITEGDSIIVKAVLDDVLLQDVQVSLQYGGTASQGKDYVLQPQYVRLTIPAGTKESEQKIHIQSLKDYLKEGEENISIRITNATPTAFVKLGSNANVIINDFYPEGKPVGPGENADIGPDPLLSPNNDGAGNEQFVIRNIERYPENEVVIFNRWGNEVYRTKGYNNSDKAFRGVANSGIGTNSNAQLTDGVYYYIIHTKVADGSQKSNKGYVILKR
nr:Calx-beta domain-containing protein [Pedobacter sp. SYSU D00873]